MPCALVLNKCRGGALLAYIQGPQRGTTGGLDTLVVLGPRYNWRREEISERGIFFPRMNVR